MKDLAAAILIASGVLRPVDPNAPEPELTEQEKKRLRQKDPSYYRRQNTPKHLRKKAQGDTHE